VRTNLVLGKNDRFLMLVTTRTLKFLEVNSHRHKVIVPFAKYLSFRIALCIYQYFELGHVSAFMWDVCQRNDFWMASHH